MVLRLYYAMSGTDVRHPGTSKEERRAHGAAKARKRAREGEAEAVGEGGKKFVGGRRPGTEPYCL